MSSDQSLPTATGEGKETDGRVAVLGRLPEAVHRDMKLAMALAGIRTNDQFVVEAVDEKARRILTLPKRSGDDRRKRDRRAA